MKSTWTKEHDELATKMWSEGYSGSQIAAAVGRTRSATLGRLHRLKAPRPDASLLPFRQRRHRKPVRNKLTRMMFADVPEPPIELHSDNNPHKSKNVPLLLSRDDQCREIVGRGSDGLALFCGEATRGSFCRYHSWLNYTAANPKRTVEPPSVAQQIVATELAVETLKTAATAFLRAP